MPRLQVIGRLSLLRVHELGTKYGPPSDQIDVEVVVQFHGSPNRAFGFRLRDDARGPAREGMLGLLRDGFNHGWIVGIDYDIAEGKSNGVLMRVWLTKPPPSPGGGVVVAAPIAAATAR
ncbi:MAG TPA: hypothetical protein VJU81_00515, partial [Methylomirabilota bacterium]|nr:hypothetical protein [Methylomirabilota bacterium]